MSNNPNYRPNDAITVSELNNSVRKVVENNIGDIWVEGEVSKLTIHSSGHWYFALKDEKAVVACAMFKRDTLSVDFNLTDGQKILVLARASLYEVAGRYQLIISKMEEFGKGDLQKKFELLKSKLHEEGLFDPVHKKSYHFCQKSRDSYISNRCGYKRHY